MDHSVVVEQDGPLQLDDNKLEEVVADGFVFHAPAIVPAAPSNAPFLVVPRPITHTEVSTNVLAFVPPSKFRIAQRNKPGDEDQMQLFG